MKKLLILSITTLLVLCGCSKKVTPKPDPSDDDTPLVEPYKDEVRALHEGSISKPITLRFFKEYQHIPYIDLSFYMKEFYFLDLNKSSSNGFYHYYKDDISLDVDTENNTFAISDIDEICNLRQFSEIVDFANTFSDHKGVQVPKKTFEFNNYDIELREGEGEAYLPLVTLNNIFTWVFGYSVSYNGKDVYVLNESAEVYENASVNDYDDYYSIISSKTKIYEDESKFNYSELCFAIDELTGHPASINIGKDELEEKGLDRVLDDYPLLKEALKSTVMNTYLNAQFLLHSILMYDGGHAGCLYQPSDITKAWEILENDTNLGIKQQEVGVRTANKMAARNGVRQYRPYDGNMYYHLESDVAYIGFDSFVVNYEGWYDHYVNEADLPDFTTDSMMFIRHFLELVYNYGYKNVVIDIASNGGGDVLALDGVLSLLVSGNVERHTMNTINNHLYSTYSQIDRDFDGLYTDADIDIPYNLNFAILTSNYSFSCGNALPTVAKDEGIMIIGEQSGGGSCYVGVYNDLFGAEYRVSGMTKLFNSDGIENDFGVPVDEGLIVYDSNDQKSYQRFYDYSYVNQKMNEFYN